MVIPLKLMKGAYVVYQQLGEDADLEEIKHALYTAFGTDPFIAWKLSDDGSNLVRWWTNIDLRRLAVPFGRATDREMVVLTMTPGIAEDGATREVLMIGKHWSDRTVITVTGWAT